MTWPNVSVTGLVVIDTLIGERPMGSHVQSRVSGVSSSAACSTIASNAPWPLARG